MLPTRQRRRCGLLLLRTVATRITGHFNIIHLDVGPQIGLLMFGERNQMGYLARYAVR